VQHVVRRERGAAIVSLAGDIDLEHSPVAREVLLDCVEREQKVIVDLSAVSYIDSSGVASLVEAFQRSRKKGGAFSLASVNPAALRVLQLARLDKVFSIHATLEEGLDGGS
jgi:anti-sigma B factor antagonist